MSRANQNWLFVTSMVVAAVFTAHPLRTPGVVRFDKVFDALGLLLCVAGLGVRIAARSWKLRAGPGILVTDGPYSVVRHPLYLGSFLAGLGLCVIFGSPGFAALFAASYLLVHISIAGHEERSLLRVWPVEYRAYSERVPAWVPSLRAAARCWRDCVAGVDRNGLLKEFSTVCSILMSACLLDVWSDCVLEGWSVCRNEAIVLLGVCCLIMSVWLLVETFPRLRSRPA